MRAAVTKIPHLLNEEDLLKTRKWCMILFTIYGLFTMDMMGMGEKPRNIYTRKTRRKLPVWLPSHPHVYKIGGRLFSRCPKKHRKQAGPTQGGTGILIYREKRNEGSDAVWVDRSR